MASASSGPIQAATGGDVTKGEAREWVHTQMIVVELDREELVAAFTVLAERVPDASDRRKGLFRRCFEIVASSSPTLPARFPRETRATGQTVS
jgi:hypothetical protein